MPKQIFSVIHLFIISYKNSALKSELRKLCQQMLTFEHIVGNIDSIRVIFS
jgi:hypothetical protein